ncbi:unnamed protein product, partial [Adineta ricciae]
MKIEYCIRLNKKNSIFLINEEYLRNYNEICTFEELFHLNINPNEIFLWSKSIDIAEQYQHYLNQENKSEIFNKIFYNCTKSWFGDQCQYSFEENDKMNILIPRSSSSFSCYELFECNRGESSFCLDWREICDGRIDCFNNGIDEMNCFHLEINECNEDEYRCHNGQCISKYYYQYEHYTVECVDQSDLANIYPCPNSDLFIDLFYCEENICPPGEMKFSCGDGQCVEDYDQCFNGRHLMLFKSLILQGNLSNHCWISMICLTQIMKQLNETFCEEFFSNFHFQQFLHSCDDLIQFPINPVLFGHIYFLYRPKQIDFIEINYVLLPDFICYDQQLCSFLHSTFFYKSFSCKFASEFGLDLTKNYKTWKSVIDTIKSSFNGCENQYKWKSLNKIESLYQCENSSKLISKHRIADGIIDCYLKEDEFHLELSCLLNDTFRFRCFNENLCRSPILKTSHKCLLNDDEKFNEILFHQICDQHIDFSSSQFLNEQNHTDESNCDNWPCNNIYTRCNGIWNCPNGEDEQMCQILNCSQNSLQCISSLNSTLICLSLNEIENEIVDCIGGIDELHLCSIVDSSKGISSHLRCLNSSTCFQSSLFCHFNQILCPEWISLNQSLLKENLCHQKSLFQLKEKISTRKRISLKSSMTCHRGYSIYISTKNSSINSLKCFCPSNYYGYFCEYQNERVSLTFTFLSPNKEILYHFFIKLINKKREIYSYEQIFFIPQSECRQSFNIYLLYSLRSKDFDENYSIHIDLYEKLSLKYISSWIFPIPFVFLPVNRMALLLTLPLSPINSKCSLKCQNGFCQKYLNENQEFCLCHSGYSGYFCEIPLNCDDCSSDSICLDKYFNRSICMCPLNQFGFRCLLKHSCPLDYCQNQGKCLVINERFHSESYLCLCSSQYFGIHCEQKKSHLKISFSNEISPSSYVFVYIYTEILNGIPSSQKQIFEKISNGKKDFNIYFPYLFQMIFIEMNQNYYLIIRHYDQLFNYSKIISFNDRCLSIDELFTLEQLKS